MQIAARRRIQQKPLYAAKATLLAVGFTIRMALAVCRKLGKREYTGKTQKKTKP